MERKDINKIFVKNKNENKRWKTSSTCVYHNNKKMKYASAKHTQTNLNLFSIDLKEISNIQANIPLGTGHYAHVQQNLFRLMKIRTNNINRVDRVHIIAYPSVAYPSMLSTYMFLITKTFIKIMKIKLCMRNVPHHVNKLFANIYQDSNTLNVRIMKTIVRISHWIII